MLSIEEYTKELGPLADKLTKEQILELKNNQEQMAELFFAMWLEKVGGTLEK